MSLTREDMLRELELLPAWRLNGHLVLPQVAAGAAHAMVDNSAVPDPDEVVSGALTEHESPAPEIRSDAPPVQTATPTLLMDEPIVSTAHASAPLDNAPVADAAAKPFVYADPLHQAKAALADDVRELQNALLEGLMTEVDDATVDDVTMALFAEDPLLDSPVDAPSQTVEHRVDDDHLPAQTMSLGEGRRESIQHLDWEGLQACVNHCQACGLCKTRTNALLGQGAPQADWLIISDAPSLHEDQASELLMGEAGELLDNMLMAIGIKRKEHAYLTSALKCHAPTLSDFSVEATQQCAPFLKRQIELIQPKVVLVLGTMAATALFGREVTVTAYGGELLDYQGLPVVVVHHPAYLLRHPLEKAATWHALCMAAKQMPQ